jgi:hypothetical protein
LAGRFSSPIRLERFRWDVTYERNQFRNVLVTFHREMVKHCDVPDFGSEELAFRFWLATGGLMGYLSKLLRQVERNAQLETTNIITLDDLHDAHMQAVWAAQRAKDFPKPFMKGFNAAETGDLINRASEIGQAVAQDEGTTRRGAPVPRRESLNSILVAR